MATGSHQDTVTGSRAPCAWPPHVPLGPRAPWALCEVPTQSSSTTKVLPALHTQERCCQSRFKCNQHPSTPTMGLVSRSNVSWLRSSSPIPEVPFVLAIYVKAVLTLLLGGACEEAESKMKRPNNTVLSFRSRLRSEAGRNSPVLPTCRRWAYRRRSP